MLILDFGHRRSAYSKKGANLRIYGNIVLIYLYCKKFKSALIACICR